MKSRCLILLVTVLALAGCGGGENAASDTTPPEAVTAVTTETVAAPPSTAPAVPSFGAKCSASSLSADLPAQDGLPAAVATLRDRIAAAAVDCDYDTLQALALEGSTGFTASYGSETSAADFWRGEEERGGKPLARLVQILGTPYGRNEADFYAWPSAYTDRPTEAQWLSLEGIYTPAEIASFKELGSYLGYRVGITPAGDWQFFVAGD